MTWSTTLPMRKRVLRSIGQMLVVVLMHAPAYSQSSDQIVWFPPIRLTDSLYDSFEPVIDISGADTIHLTWWEGSYHHRVPYRRSTDGGHTWESIKELAVDTLMFPTVFLGHKMVVKDDQVWIFTGSEPDPPGPGRMALFRSTDAGTTWTGERTAFQGTTNIKSASVNGDTMVVVYMPEIGGHLEEPRLIYSTDNGYNWTMHPDTIASFASAAVTPGALHAVTHRLVNGSVELHYLRSTNLGQTFELPLMLSPEDDQWADEQDFKVRSTSEGIVLVVAWRDEMECSRPAGCTILLRRSTNNGLSWELTETVTQQPQGYEPYVGIDLQGRIAVAWSNEMENNWIIHTHSRIQTADHLGWLETVDHTAQVPFTEHAATAISERAVHVLWSQLHANGHWCLYYQRGEFLRENQILGTYEEGWNIVSVPLRKDTSYGCFDPVYEFNGTRYLKTVEMIAGEGYWAKPNPLAVRFEGDSVVVETVYVNKGWNLVGSISSSVPISSIASIPDGIVTTNYFGYSGGQYVPSIEIVPGRGYWVKVTQNGRLIIKKE